MVQKTSAIRITAFSGLAPKIAPRLLDNAMGVIASNCKLWSGEIEPMKDSLLLYVSSKAGPLLSAIRLNGDNGADVWFVWDRDVNAVRGPIAGDTSQRIYFTGDGEPRVTNLALGIAGGGDQYPAQYYVLGIPQPDTAPTVVPTGGSGPGQESRVYAYTFCSKTTLPNGVELAEEGPPSVVTLATGNDDATSWEISDIETAPPNDGTVAAAVADSPITGQVTVTLDTVRYLRAGEEIVFDSVGGMTDLDGRFTLISVDTATNKVVVELATAQTYTTGGTWDRQAPHNLSGMQIRLYRTDTLGTYRLVVEFAVGTTTYSDTVDNLTLALRTALETQDFYQPPANLHSLIDLPNGCFAGISDNQLCFSEPYQPHAWPTRYRRTANYDGVSLGSLGNMVVMTTIGRHYVANGTDPSVVTLDESRGRAYPCINKRATVSMDQGVVWATHDGLAIQTPGGSQLFTEGILEYEEWQELNPTSMFAAVYSGRYVAGFQRENSTVQQLLILDPSEPRAFMTFGSIRADGLYGDIQTGQLYILLGGTVRVWDRNDAGKLSSDWQSKEFLLPTPVNLGAAKVDVDFTLTEAEQDALAAARAAVIGANEALIATAYGWISGDINGEACNEVEINGSLLADVPPLTYDQLYFYLYINGALKFARQVKNRRAFRLPSGYKEDTYSVRVIGNVHVKAILAATSMDALKYV